MATEIGCPYLLALSAFAIFDFSFELFNFSRAELFMMVWDAVAVRRAGPLTHCIIITLYVLYIIFSGARWPAAPLQNKRLV